MVNFRQSNSNPVRRYYFTISPMTQIIYIRPVAETPTKQNPFINILTPILTLSDFPATPRFSGLAGILILGSNSKMSCLKSTASTSDLDL